MISDAIVNVLQSHGIYSHDSDGKPIPVRSVFDHPLLTSSHREGLGSDRMKQFRKESDAYDAWLANSARGDPPSTKYPVGVQILDDLRNCQCHDTVFDESLKYLGWRVVTLEKMALKFAKCLVQTRVPVDESDPTWPVVHKKDLVAYKAKLKSEKRARAAQ